MVSAIAVIGFPPRRQIETNESAFWSVSRLKHHGDPGNRGEVARAPSKALFPFLRRHDPDQVNKMDAKPLKIKAFRRFATLLLHRLLHPPQSTIEVEMK
ncbi:hypothetical protein I6F07_21230 [Ensifer sp. IC4062]|nr:hypothetical protein [Ensifer sp. IC4062]MCA1442697.1 hypothetical protein [Ensifer sp. IC4062]